MKAQSSKLNVQKKHAPSSRLTVPFSVPLVRAASELKEIGHRLLGGAAALERIGRTGRALEIYEGVTEEMTAVCVGVMTQEMLLEQVRAWVNADITARSLHTKTGRGKGSKRLRVNKMGAT